ncbi:hypothetical protein PanWU01x14_261260, partial [Parasponia andersonii]
SSESCEIARTREQLENPASVVQDTWTTGEKLLQQLALPEDHQFPSFSRYGFLLLIWVHK